MRTVALSLAQSRHWRVPQNWMVNGYSSTQDVFYLLEDTRRIQLPPGGWSLNAAERLDIEWENTPDREGMYILFYNGRRIYKGLWTPKLLETVTESFFYDGDLFVIHYRLLKVSEQ